MHLRRGGGDNIGADGGAWQVERSVEVLDKANRAAGHKRELNAFPVLIGGVLHQCPALKIGLLPLGIAQHQPVADLPERRFGNIAHLDFTLFLARKAQLHGSTGIVRAPSKHRQCLTELGIAALIEELDRPHFIQRDGDQPLRCNQCQSLHIHYGALAAHLLLGLHSHNLPLKDFFADGLNLEHDAPELAQQLPACGERRDIHGEALESALNGILRRVDRRQRPALFVEKNQGFQNIVDLIGTKRQRHRRLARVNTALTLGVGHPRGEKCHCTNGKFRSIHTVLYPPRKRDISKGDKARAGLREFGLPRLARASVWKTTCRKRQRSTCPDPS